MARLKSQSAEGVVKRVLTRLAPEEWPARVTRLGFPPSEAMFDLMKAVQSQSGLSAETIKAYREAYSVPG